MPTKERTARERYRDAVRDIVFEMAEHIALGNMATVEPLEYGAVKFSHGGSGPIYCSCGMPAAPFPHRLRRGSGYTHWMPWWLCTICNIDTIIRLLDKVDEVAEDEAGVA